MPIAALFLMIAFVSAFSQPAMAQGAATGGTRDSAAPTMVSPARWASKANRCPEQVTPSTSAHLVAERLLLSRPQKIMRGSFFALMSRLPA